MTQSVPCAIRKMNLCILHEAPCGIPANEDLDVHHPRIADTCLNLPFEIHSPFRVLISITFRDGESVGFMPALAMPSQ